MAIGHYQKSAPERLGMELNSVQGDVKRVIAQLYIALGRHTVDKGHVLDLTYQLETLTMIQAYPGEARAEFGEYQLTKSEWRIAAYLKERFGRVVSREALLSAMHPDVDSQPEIKIIDVFICKMRQKLKDSPWAINVEHGSGYRMVPVSERKYEPGAMSVKPPRLWNGIVVSAPLEKFLQAIQSFDRGASPQELGKMINRHPASMGKYWMLANSALRGSPYRVERAHFKTRRNLRTEYKLVKQA